jgi:hypothetical protein
VGEVCDVSRLISVAHTTAAVEARIKTETRRLGWWKDKNGRHLVKPGDTLTLCRKVMGRKKGEPLDRLCDVLVLSVEREQLWDITDEGVRAEGLKGGLGGQFDEWYLDGWPTTTSWVLWFCEAMDCAPDDEVTVIKWRYLDAP